MPPLANNTSLDAWNAQTAHDAFKTITSYDINHLIVAYTQYLLVVEGKSNKTVNKRFYVAPTRE